MNTDLKKKEVNVEQRSREGGSRYIRGSLDSTRPRSGISANLHCLLLGLPPFLVDSMMKLMSVERGRLESGGV
jgi:hypothetical protein